MPPFASEALQGLTGRLVTLGLLHAIWIGLLAASLTALALRVVPRRRRRLQYGLLLTALAASALGPLVATTFQRWRAGSRESRPVKVSIARIRVIPDRPMTRTMGMLPGARPDAGHVSILKNIQEYGIEVLLISRAGVDSLQPFVLAAWLLGAVPMLLFLAVGGCASRKLRRDARVAPAKIQELSDRLSRGLGLRRGPPVLVHPHLGEPCLCGLARPAILLPGTWVAGAEASRLEAILAHELAHARRLDLPVNLVQRLIEVAFFFHPAVRWLSRSLRCQRELCADALAVSLTGNPLALAEALESFARMRPVRRRSTSLDESLGGDGLSLLFRIQEILGMTPTRPSARLWPLAALPAAILAALFSASLGLAQDPPSPTSSSGRPAIKEVHDEFAGGSRKGAHFDIRTDDTPYSTRQISYEVRFLETGASAWRDQLKDRIRPIVIEGTTDESAWLLDQEKVIDFMALTQRDPHFDLCQAPKLTAFEGSLAAIAKTYDQDYVADVDRLRRPGTLAFKSVVKKLTLGSTLEFSGTIRPGNTNFRLGLHDKALVGFHVLERTLGQADGKITAPYQVPTITNRDYRLSCPIPEGSTLMISLGFQTRSGDRSRTAGAAVKRLEVAGVPPPETRGETTERLVLITPRSFILEDENGRPDVPEIEGSVK